MAEKQFNCEKAVELIYEYLDGELNGEKLVQFEKHISECAGCRKELDEHSAFLSMLKSEGKLTPTRDILKSVMSDPEVVKLSEERRNAGADISDERNDGTSKVLTSGNKVSRFTRFTKYFVPVAAAAVIVIAVVKSPYFFNTYKKNIDNSMEKFQLEDDFVRGVPECDNSNIALFDFPNNDTNTGAESPILIDEMIEETSENANDISDFKNNDNFENLDPTSAVPTLEATTDNNDEAESNGLYTNKENTITETCGLPQNSLSIENGKIDSDYKNYYDNARLFLLFLTELSEFDFDEIAKFENSNYTINVYGYSDELAEKMKKVAENSGESYMSEEYEENDEYLIVYNKKAS